MLQPEQFKIAYEGQSDLNTYTSPMAGWHSVVARDAAGEVAGQMHWRKRGRGTVPGRVDWISVEPQHRRQGLATQMWEHAQSLDLRPYPKHSNERTDEGDAWARSVGGRLPRRRMD